jgi:hypothetical protein
MQIENSKHNYIPLYITFESLRFSSPRSWITPPLHEQSLCSSVLIANFGVENRSVNFAQLMHLVAIALYLVTFKAAPSPCMHAGDLSLVISDGVASILRVPLDKVLKVGEPFHGLI